MTLTRFLHDAYSPQGEPWAGLLQSILHIPVWTSGSKPQKRVFRPVQVVAGNRHP